MAALLLILRNTPSWAWIVLAVLVVFGIQALRARTIPLWRLLVVPVVFIGWGVIGVMQKSAASPLLGADWLLAATIGFAIAWATTRLDGVAVDQAAGRIRVPGSAVPLIRNLVVFLAKYALTAAIATAPALRVSLLPWDIAVSGITAGYFIGWLIRLAIKYRQAREPRLIAPIA